jgi:hypothetical protein
MTDLAYWGAMLIIPAAAVIVALSAFVISRRADRALSAPPAGAHQTPAE